MRIIYAIEFAMIEALIPLPIALIVLAVYVGVLLRRSPWQSTGAIMSGCLIGAVVPALMLVLAFRLADATAQLKNGAGMGAILFLPVIILLEIAIGVAGAIGASVGFALATAKPADSVGQSPSRAQAPLEGEALLDTLVRPSGPAPVRNTPQPLAEDFGPERDRAAFAAFVTMLLSDAILGAVAIGIAVEFETAGSGLAIAAVCIVAYAASCWAALAVLRLARDPNCGGADVHTLRRWAVFRGTAWTNLAAWSAMWIWLYVKA